MARSHGRVFASIWAPGSDFLTLSPGSQLRYLFLISQPDLEHSGVIPLRERRWSRSCAGGSVEQIQTELAELADARYVVIDEDSEELLVRSLIRRDEVWKQPNVFKSAARSVRTVTSPAIKAELLTELKRLDLAEAKGEVRTLRDALVAELEPFANPSRTLPEPQAKGFQKNDDEPGGRGSGYGGQVEDSPLPLPPAVPPPAAADKPRPEAQPPAKATKPGKHDRADELAKAWWERYKTSTAQSFIAVRGIVRTALANGLDRDDLARALDQLGREGRAVSGGTIQTALQRVHARASPNGLDRRQEATNDHFDRAMARAQAREAQLGLGGAT